MKKLIILSFLILVACQNIERSDPQQTTKQFPVQQYTVHEAQNIHAQIEKDKSKQFKHGRYVNLYNSEFLPHKVISRYGPIRELAYQLRQDVANYVIEKDGKHVPLHQYVKQHNMDGLIVVHKGKIVFEAYPNMRDFNKHHIFSVTKFFIGTAFAMLEERGEVRFDKLVGNYLPELKESDWGAVPIKDVLDMSSGMYEDFNKFFFEEHYWPRFKVPQGIPHARLKPYKAKTSPGQVYEYNNTNSQVLGWIIERVTGYSAYDFIQNEIWQKMGAESDALAMLSYEYVPAYIGGMSMTLRDLARFGLLFTHFGRRAPYDLISAGLIEKIQKGGRPEVFKNTGPINLPIYEDPKKHLILGEAPRHANFQLDFVMQDGDFMKNGATGQGLYVSPDKELVIAFYGSGFADHQIARKLAISGLFHH